VGEGGGTDKEGEEKRRIVDRFLKKIISSAPSALDQDPVSPKRVRCPIVPIH
jgi:hypothetical protein